MDAYPLVQCPMPAGKADWLGDHRSAAVVTRRVFLALAGAAMAAPAVLWAEETVPADLDHILLGVDDLDRGIAWVEQRTGVRAIFGGVHPGRGTRNALLSLGPRRYLEIIAPDPQQPLQGPAQPLVAMREPHLFNWAVHTDDIAAAAKRAVAAGFAIDGPTDGSRTRPDGKMLRWKACRLKDDREGLLPFFIQWDRDSLHPSEDAPSGCTLKRFFSQSPAAQELAQLCQRLGVDIAVERDDKPLLRALISSHKGQVEL
jgi:Glyoxalase-like domain